jgi:hypothetical protein
LIEVLSLWVTVARCRIEQRCFSSARILTFSSNGTGTGWKEEQWLGFQNDFMKSADKGKLIKLDCSDYVQDIEYIRISKEIRSFLKDMGV